MTAGVHDPYLPMHSTVHRLDARLKLLLALAGILTAALLPVGAWPSYLLFLALAFSAALASQLGIGRLLRRSWASLPFILAALPLLFTVPGPSLMEISSGPLHFSLSQPGIDRFLSLAVKSWLSVQAAVILTATTPFPEVLAAMRALGLPRFLTAVIGLMWRYLFVLVDSASRILRARASRSGKMLHPGGQAGGKVAWRARVTGGMAGNLLLQSLERADRIYAAMLARGYDGEIRGESAVPFSVSSWMMLAAALAVLAGLLLLGWLTTAIGA